MSDVFEGASKKMQGLGVRDVLDERRRTQYREDGFLKVQGLIPPPLLQPAIDEATRLFDHPACDAVPLGEPAIWCWRHQAGGKLSIFPLSESKVIEQLARNESLHDACRFLASSDYLQLFECVLFNKPAGIGEQFVWHSDQSYYPTEPGRSITAWIALDRCDEETGAMCFAKGSHRHGEVTSVDVKTGKPMVEGGATENIPNPETAGYQTEMAVLNPGDAVFFDAHVWHASPPNRSPNRQRRGISIRYWTEPMFYAPGPGKRALFMRQIQVDVGDLIGGPCFPIFRKTGN